MSRKQSRRGVSLSQSTYRALMRAAASRDMTGSQLVTEALRAFGVDVGETEHVSTGRAEKARLSKWTVDREQLECRHCGLPWPGDDALTVDNLRDRARPELPICIKAPPSDRWFVDSGINGHVFDRRRT